MLVLHLFHRLAVDGNEAAHDDGQQIQLLADARLLGEERFDARNFLAAHIDEEDVGNFGRSGLVQVAQEALLHEIDREDEHDARAQRGQHRGRLIAGAIEIRQTVAHGRRQMQTRAVEKEAQRAQGHGGQHQQNDERKGKEQRKPRADFGRIGKHPGNAAERGHHSGRDSQLQAARPPVGPCSTSLRSTSTGRTARTSSSGGRQKSSVVSKPVPRPASADCQGNAKRK